MHSLIKSCILISIYGYPGIDKQRIEMYNEQTGYTTSMVFESSKAMEKEIKLLENIYRVLNKDCKN